MEKERKKRETLYKKAHADEIKAEKDAAKAIENAIKKLRKEDERRQESIDKTIAKLKMERDTYGKSRAEILEYTLALKHATPEEIAQARAIAETIEELEEKTKATEEYDEAVKKHAKEIEDATKDLTDTIQEKTADIISDWDNAGDMLVDIAKRTAAEMAAAFATQKFIMPAVQQIGGMMGMQWGGVPVSQMGGAGGIGMGMPSPQAMQWAGKNIPGMGWLGSMMGARMPFTGTQVATPYAAQYLGTSPFATIGGTTLGTALGYGGWGGLGYQMIGGALGLPQSKYSGLTAGLGGALGGTYAGSIAGLLSGGAGAAGGIAAGATAGSIVPVIGTAIGAILGGLAGSLLGGDKERPDVRIGSIPGMGLSPSTHDVHGSETRRQLEESVLGYFENRLDELDEITNFSVEKAIQDVGFKAKIRLDKVDPEDPTELYEKLIESAFFGGQGKGLQAGSLREIFLERMDLSEELFDPEFFRAINIEGEDFIQTFMRFADIAEEFGNFNERIAAQVEKGISTEQAFQNMTVIAGVMDSISTAGEKLATSGVVNVLRGLITTQEEYITSLEEVGATEQELAEVQSGIAEQIGASISGLTADSMQSILLAGGDLTKTLQETLKKQAASTIAGLSSEQIMQEYGRNLNRAIGEAFREIDIEQLSAEDLTEAFNSIIGGFDWDKIGDAAQSAADAVKEFTDSLGESEQVLKARTELEIQIMELEGRASEALAMRRKVELDAMDESLRPLQRRIYFLEDLAAAEKRSDDAKKAYLSGLHSELSILEGNLSDAKSTYLKMLEDEAREQENLIKSLESSIKSIKDYRKSLFEMAMEPTEKVGVLYARRERIAGEVAEGDTGKVSDLISVSTDYLNVAKDTSKTSEEYAREVAKTNALMFGVQENLGEQLTDAESQLYATRDLISKIEGIDGKVSSIEEARIAYENAKSELDNNWYSEEIAALEDIKLSILELKTSYEYAEEAESRVAETTMTAAQKYLIDKAEAINRAGINIDYNPQNIAPGQWTAADVASAFSIAGLTPEQHYKLYGKLEGLEWKDIPGFANGGFNQGGLTITGERGPELSYRPPSQIMSNSDMMSALSNEVVVEKLKELIHIVDKGNFYIAENTKNTAKTLQKFDGDGMPPVRDEEAA
ncbi:MAG: hypothetical protein ACQ5SW_04230 [Sphaerochaetaceae bacterium]